MKYIKFGSSNCPNCVKLDALIDMHVLTNGLDVVYENIDNTSSLEYAKSLGIRAIPVIIAFDAEGNEVKRLNGLKPLPTVKAFFESS